MQDFEQNSEFSSLLLPERYTKVRLLGRGASSVVVEAQDNSLNRRVAIKVLCNTKLELAQVKRFHREAKITSRLVHPNIVSVLDFGITEAGQPFLVLEYITGQTLRELIDKHERLGSDEAREIFVGIASAFLYAQKLGIFHRDLKPDNVIVQFDNPSAPIPKIIDFGLAKYAQTSDSFVTQKGILLGTPAYMAPDEASRRAFDTRSEIYTFGCVMFESLVGHPPFEASTPVAMLAKHCNETPPVVADLIPSVDLDLSRLVEKCLRKSPSERFQSFEEIIKVLEGQPLSTEVESRLEKADSSRRKKTLKVFATLSVLILVAVTGVSLCLSQIEEPSKADSTVSRAEMEKPDELASKIMDISEHPSVTYLPATKYIKLKGDFHKEDFDELLKYPSALRLDAVFGQHLDPDGFEIVSKLPLVSVNLSHSDADDRIIHIIAGIPSLQRVVLRDTHCTDRGLTELASLPVLDELIVDFCHLSDTGVSKLCNASTLRTLSINDNVGHLTHSALKPLSKLRLRSFSFNNNEVREPEIQAISQLSAESISISNCKIGRRIAGNLKNQTVKFLDLTKNEIDIVALSSLLKLSSLETMRLSSSPSLTKPKIESLKKALNSSCKVILEQ